MPERILAVDDEPLILRSYQRTLGDKFDLVTAPGPDVALSLLQTTEFAAILSDLKMPGMDGIAFLQAARKLRPDAVRLMISGHADMGDAINSVNRAGIFRLMLKPCPDDEIAAALTAAIEQHRLVIAERQLLEGTLNGAVQMLTEILSTLDAEVYGQARLRGRLAREVAVALKEPTWTFEVAALLAEIGRATLPPALNRKLREQQKLTESEHLLVERLPEISSRLLRNIPRFDAVAQAVLYQNKQLNGAGFPAGAVTGADIPVAARMLHAVNALLDLVGHGMEPADGISLLKQNPERYDPGVVMGLYAGIALLESHRAPVATETTVTGPGQVTVADLAPGMILLAPIVSDDGLVILGAGTQLSDFHVQRVQNFADLNRIAEPILVEIPPA